MASDRTAMYRRWRGIFQRPARQDIIDQAIALGADRIKFIAPEKNLLSISPFSEILSQDAISEDDFFNGKFLFQRKIEGSYKNATGWVKVFDIDKCENAFLTGYKKTHCDSTVALLIAKLPQEKFTAILRKFCYNLIQDLPKNRNLTQLKNAITYIEPITNATKGSLHKNLASCYVNAYLHAYLVIFNEYSLSDTEQVYIPKSIEKIKHLLLNSNSKGESIAFLNILGQLTSIQDREKSFHLFKSALDLDIDQLISKFYMDMGIYTYFENSEIPQENSIELEKLKTSMSKNITGKKREDSTLLLSVDENFFRIYGPQLAFYAQQSSGIDFNIIVIAEGDITDLISDYHLYIASLSKLNTCPPPDNLIISVSRIPEYVKNKITFFACARFLYLSDFLSEYDRVYVIDADMHYEQDPGGFVNSLKGPLSVVRSKGLTRIPPWRRTMAGNLLITKEYSHRYEFSSTLANYIIKGLSQDNSWMLDQNALTFALEMHGDQFFEDLGTKYRPFHQPLFRARWEHNFRINNKSPS